MRRRMTKRRTRLKERWWALIDDERSRRLREGTRKDAAIERTPQIIMHVDEGSLHNRLQNTAQNSSHN
jgi:hypothetical protein